MKSVLAVDVAKDKSMVALITEYGEILIEPYEVIHNLNNFNELEDKISRFNLDNVTIIMESTSSYHKPIQRYFKENNYKVEVINPILGKQNKRNLRKTKTDKEDCYRL